MTALRSILCKLVPLPCARRRATVEARLIAATEAIEAAGDAAATAAREVVEASKANQAAVDDLQSDIQARLESIDARRRYRDQDPRLAVVIETVRILKGSQ